ncbi:MAG TPA: 4-(cytidine 5'-diphospho)-2-C-methyl-D-erythritol kinase [Deltaproteobacteria bacterium]|nr:4-(cytidine 5'-diphospho)-2-C-methyl-D-erythritol kinase [Deltaproteobacteria bacterium]HPR54840.1 4-(cytidine 5'-diphospho)-2-C-methyl-D-erythritol kinase [Deltaproteobacteria bacterium]HXK46535.1 4-(cytidine 5'-diphospho)-2-C-methyl-D-erythritol kinase [Deltaproteobacteria bacterium]
MKIFSPSKINIYLEVVGRKPDGYHELRTIMVPLSFGDEIDLDHASSGISLEARGCGCTDDKNLAYRAARLFFSRVGDKGGLAIRIAKRIPVGAGLGGGSSNAASVLLGLNEMFQAGLTEEELAAMAGELGADCPFFVYRRPMLLGSRGDVPLMDVNLQERAYLIVIPPLNLSTTLIFSKLRLPLTREGDRIKIEKISDTCIEPEHWVSNDLEFVACTLYPELTGIKGELLSSGALKAGMSGSGSAFFGIYASQAHLLTAMGRLTRHEGYSYIPTTRLTGDIYGDY